MSDLTLRCPAKINLTLFNHGRVSTDGYHDVTTLLAKIPLYDYLQVSFLPEYCADHIIECQEEKIPCNEDNLMMKVLRLLERHYHLPKCLIKLEKNIPVGSGLGGGSSDAGALLVGLNRRLNLNIKNSRMQKLALQIGADVPFFTRPEKVSLEYHHGRQNLRTRAYAPLPACKILLVYQDYSLETPAMYQLLDKYGVMSTNDQDRVLPTDGDAWNLTTLARVLTNDFARLLDYQAIDLHGADKIVADLQPMGLSLTGKGPTLFAIFAPEQVIDREKLQGFAYQLIQVKAHNCGYRKHFPKR
ncbi:hypothetical protein IJJ08_02460 [bacterium]|nr:hypothetical protein [bacterium]